MGKASEIKRRSHKHYLAISIAWLLVLNGCSGQAKRILPPEINAKEAGATAISSHDTDGDKILSGKELLEVPSLKSGMRDLDKNDDGGLSADEISQEIEAWKAAKVGLVLPGCQVTLDGRPLEGATVTLMPEPFLGENVKSASGVTDTMGRVVLAIAEEHRMDPSATGVQCGYFQVRISKQQDGKETLPARYNVNTTLGCKVARLTALQGLNFALKSK
ncbi:MAG: hypothetical protein GXP26_04370 [Planctomycetes bacterium]|nr:hypothetical protein [Planctomycetota bacterium]